jgi:hypothetical protein
MTNVAPSGTHRIRLRDASGRDQDARLSVKFATMVVRPPIGRPRRYEPQQLQIIHAEEIDPPAGRPPLLWKLITNLEVTTHDEAVGKLNWYARRHRIEIVFTTTSPGVLVVDCGGVHGRCRDDRDDNHSDRLAGCL